MLKWLGIFFVTIGVVKLIVACAVMISEKQKQKEKRGRIKSEPKEGGKLGYNQNDFGYYSNYFRCCCYFYDFEEMEG